MRKYALKDCLLKAFPTIICKLHTEMSKLRFEHRTWEVWDTRAHHFVTMLPNFVMRLQPNEMLMSQLPKIERHENYQGNDGCTCMLHVLPVLVLVSYTDSSFLPHCPKTPLSLGEDTNQPLDVIGNGCLSKSVYPTIGWRPIESVHHFDASAMNTQV